MATSPATTARLGRVERVILQELGRADGLTQRQSVVAAAFPASTSGAPPARPQARERRARAEAAVSRAILTLERKGLLVRERNARTGRTTLRAADRPALPVWELLARAEEDMAVHCRRTAAEWQGLAGRARRRAEVVRLECSTSSSDEQREADLELMRRLGGSAP